jgi:hypothetical protein
MHMLHSRRKAEIEIIYSIQSELPADKAMEMDDQGDEDVIRNQLNEDQVSPRPAAGAPNNLKKHALLAYLSRKITRFAEMCANSS